jgi:peptidoglycan-associated lipoprotein
VSAVFISSKIVKFAAVALIALSLGACSKNAADENGGLGGSGLNGGAGGLGGSGSQSPGSVGDFTVNIGDRVLFESDSSELTSVAQSTLDKQSQWLNKYPKYNFAVEGHADERGTREYNFALGARRAEATKNYLVARGVNASRVRTTSYGKERPVAVCDNISCWSQNRRAVTILGGAGS